MRKNSVGDYLKRVFDSFEVGVSSNVASLSGDTRVGVFLSRVFDNPEVGVSLHVAFLSGMRGLVSF